MKKYLFFFLFGLVLACEDGGDISLIGTSGEKTFTLFVRDAWVQVDLSKGGKFFAQSTSTGLTFSQTVNIDKSQCVNTGYFKSDTLEFIVNEFYQGQGETGQYYYQGLKEIDNKLYVINFIFQKEPINETTIDAKVLAGVFMKKSFEDSYEGKITFFSDQTRVSILRTFVDTRLSFRGELPILNKGRTETCEIGLTYCK